MILLVSLMCCLLVYKFIRLILFGMLCGEFNRIFNCWIIWVILMSFLGLKFDGWNYFLNLRCDLKLGFWDVKSSKDENKWNLIFVCCIFMWCIIFCLVNVGVSYYNV